MNNRQILNYRLENQEISSSLSKSPEDLVKKLVAVQAQVFSMAKWALGLRLPNTTDDEIVKSYNEGNILRTHVLRPTWHFVSPEDIGWLQMLTGPRVQIFSKNVFNRMGLDDKIFTKSTDLITRSLQGHNYLHRNDIREILKQNGFKVDGVKLACYLMKAELEGLICSGPLLGKQFSYALIEERVKTKRNLLKQESLHELTKRYFETRGPATVHDFSWWSGLTIKEIKKGVNSLPFDFVKEKVNGMEYIYKPQMIKNIAISKSTFLMPDFDEYGIAYKDRSAFLIQKSNTINQYTFPTTDHLLIVNGIRSGTWKPVYSGNKLEIKVIADRVFSNIEHKAVTAAINKYLKFFNHSKG